MPKLNSDIPAPLRSVAAVSFRYGERADVERSLPEETPVVLTYDRVSFAVMMATPADLEDFAAGFSMSEGIISAVSEIIALDVVVLEDGVECRMSLTSARRLALETRRRTIAGPMGCGLCGIDSLKQALRPLPVVQSSLRISAEQINEMVTRMPGLQKLNQETRAVHAAAFLNPAAGEFLLREDVGRHNALDKLIGAAARRRNAPAQGVICVTSRVSIELIQKAALFGAPIMVAISVPTARAVREAEAAGITLAAVARDDGFEVFTHPARIMF